MVTYDVNENKDCRLMIRFFNHMFCGEEASKFMDNLFLPLISFSDNVDEMIKKMAERVHKRK
jgi:hypothetical protein